MFIILSGNSGAGKNTVANEIKKRIPKIESIPSFTTRAPRADDIPGVTYNFVTPKEFERMIKDGELYEYDIHHENYYGTSKKLLNDKINNGISIIKDIEVNGTENLVKLLKDDVKLITIFLKVPKKELERRLHERVDKLSEEEIKLRLSRCDYENSKIGIYDYVINNNDLEKTTQIIMKIIEEERKLENK